MTVLRPVTHVLLDLCDPVHEHKSLSEACSRAARPRTVKEAVSSTFEIILYYCTKSWSCLIEKAGYINRYTATPV